MGGHPLALAGPQFSWSGQLGPPTEGPAEEQAQRPPVGRGTPADVPIEVEGRRGRVEGQGGAGAILLVQALVLKR